MKYQSHIKIITKKRKSIQKKVHIKKSNRFHIITSARQKLIKKNQILKMVLESTIIVYEFIFYLLMIIMILINIIYKI